MSDQPKSTEQSDATRDLPLKDQQAKEIQGGRNCVAGEHIKETTITVRG